MFSSEICCCYWNVNIYLYQVLLLSIYCRDLLFIMVASMETIFVVYMYKLCRHGEKKTFNWSLDLTEHNSKKEKSPPLWWRLHRGLFPEMEVNLASNRTVPVPIPGRCMSIQAMQSLFELRENNLLCDAVIRLEDGGIFPVHRAILSASSSYFRLVSVKMVI